MINLRKTATMAVLAAISVVAFHALPAQNIGPVPYPQDYRKWVHVKTALVGPQSPFFGSSGGFHHIYANDKALEGYASGRFPDGAILVFDLLQSAETAGTTVEGPRERIDVMVRDSRRFASTGGWAYERFAGDSQTERPLTEEQRTRCFTCHTKRQAHDFVFSEYRK